MGEKSQFWRRWLSNLLMLSSVALPICLKAIDFDRVQNAELHHFADAPHIQNSSMKIAVPTAVSSLGNLA